MFLLFRLLTRLVWHTCQLFFFCQKFVYRQKIPQITRVALVKGKNRREWMKKNNNKSNSDQPVIWTHITWCIAKFPLKLKFEFWNATLIYGCIPIIQDNAIQDEKLNFHKERQILNDVKTTKPFNCAIVRSVYFYCTCFSSAVFQTVLLLLLWWLFAMRYRSRFLTDRLLSCFKSMHYFYRMCHPNISKLIDQPIMPMIMTLFQIKQKTTPCDDTSMTIS